MQAVITGEVDLATLTVNLAAPTILADKVTGIAITSAQRLADTARCPDHRRGRHS
jgi:hypothetical protein